MDPAILCKDSNIAMCVSPLSLSPYSNQPTNPPANATNRASSTSSSAPTSCPRPAPWSPSTPSSSPCSKRRQSSAPTGRKRFCALLVLRWLEYLCCEETVQSTEFPSSMIIFTLGILLSTISQSSLAFMVRHSCFASFANALLQRAIWTPIHLSTRWFHSKSPIRNSDSLWTLVASSLVMGFSFSLRRFRSGQGGCYKGWSDRANQGRQASVPP